MSRSLIVFYPFILCSCLVFRKHDPSTTFSRSMTASEYVHWTDEPDYPYRDTQTVGGVQFILEYQPVEAELSRLLCGKRTTVPEAKEVLLANEGGMHFELTIRVPKPGTGIYAYASDVRTLPADRGTFFAYGFRHSLRLVEGIDTLLPSAFLHERGLPENPSATFSIDYATSRAFDKQELVVYHPFVADSIVHFPLNSWPKGRLPKLKFPN